MSVQRTAYSVQRKKKGLIFVISGPSGSGKTTLLVKLLNYRGLGHMLERPVSFTTRPRRSGEKNGLDYFFISLKRFIQLKKAKKILEWTRYLGYYYATPKDFVEGRLATGGNLIFSLDLRGALKIKRFYPDNTLTIFILPPSLEVLRDRIEKRCKKTKKEEVRGRLRLAQQEIRAYGGYDYCLTNQDLGDTVRELKKIVLREIESKS